MARAVALAVGQNFIAIRNIAVVLILVINTNVSFGQLTFLPNDISKMKKNLPEKIKTIRQFEEGYLINVREYDTLKNLVFSHYKQFVGENWKGKYVTMITGNLYDDSGKISKSYHLHSNTGLSIWYHDYDEFGNNTKIYIRNNREHHDSLINKNPYQYISEISNLQELINHPKIIQTDSIAEKRLGWERTFDSAGNVLIDLLFNQNGDTSSIKKYEYDDYGNNIYFSNQWGEAYWEVFYEYEPINSFFDNESIDELKQKKLIQSVRIDNDLRENRKRIADITFYNYDDLGRLNTKTRYSKGEFQDKYIYEYTDKDQVASRTSYVYDLEKEAHVQTSKYNDEGNVIEESNVDIRTGENNTTKYSYEYTYFY